MPKKSRSKAPITIEKKAKTFLNGLAWGRGGNEKMIAFIESYLGKPCRYTGKILTLDNMSLDHRYPVMRSKTRTHTSAELLHLNSVRNLQIISKEANKVKGKIPEDKFEKLFQFLKQDPELFDLVWDRMRQSQMMWMFAKRR